MSLSAPERVTTLPPPAPPTSRRSPELLWALATIVAVSVPYVLLARDGPPAASGLLGHALGIAGFLLMLFAELGYSWRKRTSRGGPGPVRRWMQAHVYAGLVGPYLVLLHGAFRFHGVAAAALLLTGVVVLSGLVGRVAYASTPRVVRPDGAWARWNPLRRALSPWYLLHVPLALALFALALVHVAGALYYATLLR